MVHWQPPSSCMCKINTDSSCSIFSGRSSCGGVIRNVGVGLRDFTDVTNIGVDGLANLGRSVLDDSRSFSSPSDTILMHDIMIWLLFMYLIALLH
ncbi:hypothetical protein V6N12_046388 [Hibiscus sabdariffa]|uniref:Uncharacterized protein n=1 Tax=Hibiscus sabdariffa TaxID=183260 RepID=A0ABR2DJN7_9ROSI